MGIGGCLICGFNCRFVIGAREKESRGGKEEGAGLFFALLFASDVFTEGKVPT